MITISLRLNLDSDDPTTAYIPFEYQGDELIGMIQEAPNFTEEACPIKYSCVFPVRSNS